MRRQRKMSARSARGRRARGTKFSVGYRYGSPVGSTGRSMLLTAMRPKSAHVDFTRPVFTYEVTQNVYSEDWGAVFRGGLIGEYVHSSLTLHLGRFCPLGMMLRLPYPVVLVQVTPHLLSIDLSRIGCMAYHQLQVWLA